MFYGFNFIKANFKILAFLLNTGATSFWTVPAVVYEYEVLIEMNTSDIDQLRDTLKSVTFPASVSTHTNISNATITTGKAPRLFLCLSQLCACGFFSSNIIVLKFVDQLEAVSSANVRLAIYGHVTSVSCTGNVTMTQIHVTASEVSRQTDNTVRQYNVKVGFNPCMNGLTYDLMVKLSCTFVWFWFYLLLDYSTCQSPTGKTSKTLVEALFVTFQSCFHKFCLISCLFSSSSSPWIPGFCWADLRCFCIKSAKDPPE